MKPYFDYEETQFSSAHVRLVLKHELLPLQSTKGSFGILPSRLMGISYPNYLRFCRDELNAIVVGKNHLYIDPIFLKTKEFFQFLKVLNGLAALALTEGKKEYYSEQIRNLKDSK